MAGSVAVDASELEALACKNFFLFKLRSFLYSSVTPRVQLPIRLILVITYSSKSNRSCDSLKVLSLVDTEKELQIADEAISL